MSFQHEIELWDGKTVAALDAIFARYSQQNEFVTALITYLEELVLQVGASWLLKKVAESDRTFSLSEVGTIYTLLPQLEAWQTKLHLLQLLPFLPINNKQKEPVKTFLRLFARQ